MLLTITLPDRETALARHRERWEQVIADPRWQVLPERVETNGWGQIVLTPPPRFIHSRQQAKIATLLERHLGGFSATETGLITGDGVKIVDVVWLSAEMFHRLSQSNVLTTAPEICIEILSPSNSTNEIDNKLKLYFDAGAIECWTCDQQGQMNHYHHSDPSRSLAQSTLCPDFPKTIVDIA